MTTPVTTPDSPASRGPAAADRAAPAHRRILAQAGFEARSILRNGEQLLLSLVLPIIVLLGLSLTGILDVLGLGIGGHSPVAVATSGVLGLAIASTAFTGQAISTGFDRRYGVLRQLATTPLGTTGLIWGKLLAVLLVVAVQFALIGGIALVLGITAPVAHLAVVVAGLLGTAVMLTWGLVLAGTLRAEATLALANLLWVLMASVGGLVVAHDGLWGALVAWTPSGALGDAMRSAVLDGAIDLRACAVLLAWTLLGLLAARRFFDFDGR